MFYLASIHCSCESIEGLSGMIDFNEDGASDNSGDAHYPHYECNLTRNHCHGCCFRHAVGCGERVSDRVSVNLYDNGGEAALQS